MCIKLPITRASSFPVLIYMLLGFQSSAEAFHLIVPHIPSVSIKKGFIIAFFNFFLLHQSARSLFCWYYDISIAVLTVICML